MSRATKVCGSDLDLHTEYLRILEKNLQPFTEVDSEFQRLIHIYKNSFDDVYILYTSFLSYCVRHLRTLDNPYEIDATDDYINPLHISLLR